MIHVTFLALITTTIITILVLHTLIIFSPSPYIPISSSSIQDERAIPDTTALSFALPPGPIIYTNHTCEDAGTECYCCNIAQEGGMTCTLEGEAIAAAAERVRAGEERKKRERTCACWLQGKADRRMKCRYEPMQLKDYVYERDMVVEVVFEGEEEEDEDDEGEGA